MINLVPTQQVRFDLLETGDTFESRGGIYLKTEKGESYTLVSNDMDRPTKCGEEANFLPDSVVRKVDLKLSII